MKWLVVALLAPALVLGGCTSTIKPVTVPLASKPPEVQICKDKTAGPQAVKSTIYTEVSPRDRLQWYVCALRTKADANLVQAQKWENQTEWRDLPMIAAAATIAGLVLFGKRDAEGKALTPGTQDAVAAVGFGAATFAAFSNYLSPQKARTVLRQSARGHYCLATEGELILSVYDSVERKTQRDELVLKVAELSAALEREPGKFGKLAEAKTVRDAANKAVATYDIQIRQLDTASIELGETAWNFGLDLMARSDRGEQNVDALVKAISEQTASATKFATTAQAVSDPVPKAVVAEFIRSQRVAQLAAKPKAVVAPVPDELTADVAVRTALLLDGLVNVEALVLGFDKCAATALAGGTPKADRIQRITLQ